MKSQVATLCLIVVSALFTASHPTPQVPFSSKGIDEKDIRMLLGAPKSYQIIGEEVRTNKMLKKLKEEDSDEGCSEHWGQCGGINWTGPTCCKTGYVCHEYNPWYFQCVE